jgi:hypothetical protein
VVTPHVHSEVDVLARGGGPRMPSLPAPVRRLLMTLIVVVLVAGWLVDQRLRHREAAGLDTCADQATAAVDAALGPVRSMSEYVRPTLAGAESGELRRGLYALIGGVADTTEDLRASLTTCRGVQVLAVHDELRARRAGCELLVRQTIAYLDRVARDGREAFRSWPGTDGSAAVCAG